jgi:hypothetical protein
MSIGTMSIGTMPCGCGAAILSKSVKRGTEA